VRKRLALRGLECLWLVLPAAWAQTQTLDSLYYQWEPPVLRSGSTQSVRLEVKLVGKPSQIEIELDPTGTGITGGNKLPLRDDGTGGDRVASDNIWTAMLNSAQIVQGLRADDLFSRFVGFVQAVPTYILPCGLPWRLNIFAPVASDEVVRMAVGRPAADVQYTAYVANIADAAWLKDDAAQLNYGEMAKKFYRTFPDGYDFLNIVTYGRVYFSNRGHMTVSNDVQGIGATIFNQSANYGSTGRLKGITVFPNFTFFDGAETAYQHELGHQWINFLNVPPLASAKPHWPLSSLASGIMGFSIPPTNEGGDFACQVLSEAGGVRLVPRTEAAVFTDLDLYLMGLAPAEEVQEHIVLAEQDVTAVLQQCNRQLYSGSVTRVRLADIVKVAGARAPAYGTAPRRFKVATLVVSPSLLSEDALALASFFARRAEETAPAPIHSGFAKMMSKPFAMTTRGRGSLDATLLVDPASVPQVSAAGVVNAASGRGGAVSAGEIVSIYGLRMGTASGAGLRLTPAGLVATTLANTRVYFDGVEAPLTYARADQVNAVVPYSVAGKSTVQMRVDYMGVWSDAVTLNVAPAAPGIFTATDTGRGQAAALNEDWSYNSANQSGGRGKIIMLYLTGEGQTNPAGVDGKPGAVPLPVPRLPVVVRIGGLEADVLYRGGAPGLVAGVMQINVRIPEGVSPGPAVPVEVLVGGVSSQPGVTIAVQ